MASDTRIMILSAAPPRYPDIPPYNIPSGNEINKAKNPIVKEILPCLYSGENFEGYDKVTYSGNPIAGYNGTVASPNALIFSDEQGGVGTFGRAIYRPWMQGGQVVPFHTDDKWITVTIPISDFRYDRMGVATTNLPDSPDDFASLTFFVVGGGVNGQECTPVLMIDNIRAVPNR